MNDKYNLTKEQSIFLAKKTIVQNIYNLAKLEGCNVTFPQTQTILDGVNDSDVSIDDLQTVINLKNAWEYTIKNIDEPFDLKFICEINKRVSKNESLDWGVLRYGNVGISGVDNYTPEIPVEEEVTKKLDELSKIENVTERAIKYYLWAMRTQLFWDGNKRTSNICANKILIKEGKGIITIPEKKLPEFNKRLTEFYNTNDYSKIDNFLYDNCLCGIEIKKEKPKIINPYRKEIVNPYNLSKSDENDFER